MSPVIIEMIFFFNEKFAEKCSYVNCLNAVIYLQKREKK